MKASPFSYLRAKSIGHALEHLHQHGSDCRILAGGQSLVPMMAMRLATPAALVDINRIASLSAIEPGTSNWTTGATLRQCDLLTCPGLDAQQPLLHAALPWVGHQQTRNRGTVGGSIAQADPSAELPLVACVLDARIALQVSDTQTRTVRGGLFFEGPLQTCIGDSEMLSGIAWPVWQPAAGETVQAVFDEVAIRHGDFAIASAACQIQAGVDGSIRRAAFGLGGVDAIPLAFPDLAGRLVNEVMTASLAKDVAGEAARSCDPGSDIHASAEYRRHLAALLLTRALLRCANQAKVMAQGVY